MTQPGFLVGGSQVIDSLRYTYLAGGSNKLMSVRDTANNPTTQLGDFHYNPATKQTTDYAYDPNGNLIQDNNKAVTSVSYNYLNLPQLVHFQSKGNISYVYDASGEKLAKITCS
jgi:YD repeat-containing protein